MVGDLLFQKTDEIVPQSLFRCEGSAQQIGQDMRLVEFVGVGTTYPLAAHQPLLGEDTEGAEFQRMGDTCTPGYLTRGGGITTRKVDECAENCNAAGVSEDLIERIDQTHMVRNL